MRKLIVAVGAVVALAACQLTAASIITAADIGVEIAKTIHEARNAHPDDLAARIDVYAGLYCRLREEKGLVWSEIRDAAIGAGAPESVVGLVRSAIDTRCGADPAG